MSKVASYILWPAIAGFVLAAVLLAVPGIAERIPALQAYLPRQEVVMEAPPQVLSFSAAVKMAAPAVVSINNQELVAQPVITFRGINVQEVPSNSLGSGVILNPEGFIITSYHVMMNPAVRFRTDQDITVTLNDRRTYDARLLMLDEEADLALLKIDADDLRHLESSNNVTLQVGDIVLAIGNPRNIGQSVTFGIISALWRRQDSYVIQTDAAINPGNSGGALIDIHGRFIGVNSSIVSGSGGSEGISFAVPAEKAMELLQRYLDSNPGGYLGVNADPITLGMGQQHFGADVQGFLVNEVTPNSPAYKAGLKEGDLITAVNGRKLEMPTTNDVAKAYEAISVISGLPQGAEVQLEIYRDGAFIEVAAVLGYGGAPAVFEQLRP